MSKQSEAKAKQGYVPKAIPQTCGHCEHFRSDFIRFKSVYSNIEWTEEKNIRCVLGGFAVKKMGTCNEFRHFAGVLSASGSVKPRDHSDDRNLLLREGDPFAAQSQQSGGGN